VVRRPDGLHGGAPTRKTEGEKFKDYFDFSEPLTKTCRRTASWQCFRGEKEEILDLAGAARAAECDADRGQLL